MMKAGKELGSPVKNLLSPFADAPAAAAPQVDNTGSHGANSVQQFEADMRRLQAGEQELSRSLGEMSAAQRQAVQGALRAGNWTQNFKDKVYRERGGSSNNNRADPFQDPEGAQGEGGYFGNSGAVMNVTKEQLAVSRSQSSPTITDRWGRSAEAQFAMSCSLKSSE